MLKMVEQSWCLASKKKFGFEYGIKKEERMSRRKMSDAERKWQ